jgi:N-acetyl-gamma-glutamyl-phosphate reductase
MNNKIHAGIIGETGYVGMELVRILSEHPEVALATFGSRPDIKLTNITNCDVIFFATPSGVAMNYVPTLLDKGIKIIDLSADFRLKDISSWEKWYNMSHACSDLVSEAVYGLSELNRKQIKSARLVANPGCYATAVLLGLIPLIKKRIIDTKNLIANAVSGISGAGRKAKNLCPEMKENFRAYDTSGHRHLPEIKQCLEGVFGKSIGLTFVPHMAPMFRGIHATLYGRLKREVDLQDLFEQYYIDEPFIDVAPARWHPQTSLVCDTNYCRIAVCRPQNENTVVVLSVIDNLIKGAAGQAVQNMNIMFDIAETSGLLIT